jgi:ATP-dependent RNA helicase RhlE
MSREFSTLDLLPSIQQTLEAGGFTTLTPVQQRALPELLAKRSVVAIAETGSGKTLTYVLPILDRLKRMEDDGNPVAVGAEPRALVIVPTRELGEQVARVFKTFTHDTRLRVRFLLGGRKATRTQQAIAGTFEVLVATPGRLKAMLDREILSLDSMRIVVLDEADQLLDLGFLPTVLDVVKRCPSWRQLGLFSATMSEPVRELVSGVFSEAILVETKGAQKLVPTLSTRHINLPDGKRFSALVEVLAEPTSGGTMLFANTRSQADRIVNTLREEGWTCAVHRGDMDAIERRRNLIEFRTGELQLLVTTDMGARGLDIDHLSRVINVHMPRTMEAYLHRVGRTARAGRKGLVVNLVTPRDAPFIALLDDGHVAPVYVEPTGPGRHQR